MEISFWPKSNILCHPVFQSAKARLKVMEEDQRALQWEHEVLEQRFEKVGNSKYAHSTKV